MQEPILTLSITTPETWARRRVKRRRVARSPRRNVVQPKQLDPKIEPAKAELLQKAIEKQTQIRKSPANGAFLDPFETFPIPTTPSVAGMAQYCQCPVIVFS